MTTLRDLTAVSVGWVSLTEVLDLTTPAGRAGAGFPAVCAECEWDVIRERIKAGMTDARQRGKAHGRPRATAKDAPQMRALAQQGFRQAALAQPLGLWKTSVRRVWVQQEGTGQEEARHDAAWVYAAPATWEVNLMMPFEQQVCSHELAKRLAALGVRQESVFWWVDRKVTYTGGRASHAPLQGGIAAFTVAELGEMLPDEITIPSKNGKPHTHWLRFGRYRGAGPRFWCAYPGGTARTNLEERAHTEADARAQLLIYLLEHHLLSSTGLHA